MNRFEYLKARELQHLAWVQRNDYFVTLEIQRRMNELRTTLIKENEQWFLKYAFEEGITPSELSVRVGTEDIEALRLRAIAYIETKDMSETARRELKWYNKIQNVSRKELLIRNLDINLTGTMGEIDDFLGNYLHTLTIEELRRQSSLLGLSVTEAENLVLRARGIAESPFYGATYSQTLWEWKDKAENALIRGINRSILTGQSPLVWKKDLEKFFIGEVDNLAYATKRLAVTETARAQIMAQKVSYQASDYDEFVVICEPTACPICMEYDGIPEKVSNMRVGENSPPFHPNCKCSTSANVSQEEVDDAIGAYLAELEDL